MADIHVGDVGTRLTVTVTTEAAVVIDLSTATTKEIWLQSPTGVTAEKAATFTTDGTDGKIYYDTLAADLSMAGQWRLQAYVVLPTGTWHSDVAHFDVVANLA